MKGMTFDHRLQVRLRSYFGTNQMMFVSYRQKQNNAIPLVPRLPLGFPVSADEWRISLHSDRAVLASGSQRRAPTG